MMEVDDFKNGNYMEETKFSNLKGFATAARSFEATHNLDYANRMTRLLEMNNIATTSKAKKYDGYKTYLEQKLFSQPHALQHMETKMKVQEKKLKERLKQRETNNRLLQKKLEEQHKKITMKVLEKELEVRLKQQKKLEEQHKKTEMKVRQKELKERLKQQEANNKALQKKLNQKVRVLAADGALRQELRQKNVVIKRLQKIVVENENKMCQMTLQLNEKSRKHHIATKIMNNRFNGNFR